LLFDKYKNNDFVRRIEFQLKLILKKICGAKLSLFSREGIRFTLVGTI